ncbi:MAG: GntR family transcriptional regulator [Deltaproteobacteria bacterium]
MAEFLRESIIAGTLKPGEKIRNADIAQELGVSSIPVREALRLLEKEALIVSHPGRGSWVAGASRSDLGETFEIREMLETFAVDLIERRIKDGAHIQEKLQSLAVDRETALSGPEGCVSFHDFLIQSAGNSKLIYAYYTTFNNIKRYQRLAYRIREDEEEWVEEHVKEHLEILDALIKGDYRSAKASITFHLNKLKELLLERVEFSPATSK